MYSELKPFLKTVEDKNLLFSEVSILLSSVYSVKEDAMEENLRFRVRSEIAAILRERMKSGQKEQILKELAAELEMLEVVHLTLAYQPSNEFLEILSQKIQNGEKHRLLAIEMKPSLIGGLEISFAGKFANFSLQKKVEELCGSPQFHSLLEPYFSN